MGESMSNFPTTLTAVSAALLLGHATAVQANGLSGTFLGYTTHATIGGDTPNPRTFDGARVEGTFRFEVPEGVPPAHSDPGPVTYFFADTASTTLTFHVIDQTVVFPLLVFPSYPGSGNTALVRIDQQGPEPVVDVLPADEVYRRAALTLVPRAGSSLVDGFDPGSFRAGLIDFSRTHAAFATGRGTGASVVIDRLRFDGFPEQVASVVPEPQAWLLLAAGVVLASWVQRRGDRHASGGAAA
jgi:hypothetical protein